MELRHDDNLLRYQRLVIFFFSGLLAMAGVGATFLFVALEEATPAAVSLNVVGLLFAAINYWRGKLITGGGGILHISPLIELLFMRKNAMPVCFKFFGIKISMCSF